MYLTYNIKQLHDMWCVSVLLRVAAQFDKAILWLTVS